MPDPIDEPAFSSMASPLIEDAAARLARRLSLAPCDEDDLKQELWLHLLLWQREAVGGPWSVEPLIHYAEVAQRVRRLADFFARSPTFRRRFGPHHERPSSHWLGNGLAAKHSADAQRRDELRLDVAIVLTRLPADLCEACERLLRDVSPESNPLPDTQLADRATVAVRRVFWAHHLHEYL